jgi:hypothetical protein
MKNMAKIALGNCSSTGMDAQSIRVKSTTKALILQASVTCLHYRLNPVGRTSRRGFLTNKIIRGKMVLAKVLRDIPT